MSTHSENEQWGGSREQMNGYLSEGATIRGTISGLLELIRGAPVHID